jgi:hypothetical protein
MLRCDLQNFAENLSGMNFLLVLVRGKHRDLLTCSISVYVYTVFGCVTPVGLYRIVLTWGSTQGLVNLVRRCGS